MDAGGMSPRMDEVDNVWNKLSRAMQEQLPRVAMHGLEKSVRDPENTALKAPASKNLCIARVESILSIFYSLIL
jgi:hypothetical protein